MSRVDSQRVRNLITVLAGGIAIGAFYLASGNVGAFVGISVAGVALVSSPIFGFVIGCLLLLWVFPDPSTVDVLQAQVGLGPMVIAGVYERGASVKIGILVGLTFIMFSAIGLIAVESFDSIIGVGVVLTGVIGLVLYGLHRYELVTLGLVEG